MGFGQKDQKEVEGHWASAHILIGFLIDVNSGCITLPVGKLEGAKRLLSLPIYDPGSQIIPAKALQELRGCYTHWQMANHLWGYFARPADALLAHVGEIGVWIRRAKT